MNNIQSIPIDRIGPEEKYHPGTIAVFLTETEGGKYYKMQVAAGMFDYFHSLKVDDFHIQYQGKIFTLANIEGERYVIRRWRAV